MIVASSLAALFLGPVSPSPFFSFQRLSHLHPSPSLPAADRLVEGDI